MSGGKGSKLVLVGLLLVAQTAALNAQWVMAGRAVANRVRRMTQSTGAGGYDVATVLLEAPAQRVYEGALKALKAHSDVKITKHDQKGGTLEFRKGAVAAGLQITPVSDQATQLVIASGAGDATQASATPLVVEAVLRICQEVKVQCRVEQD